MLLVVVGDDADFHAAAVGVENRAADAVVGDGEDAHVGVMATGIEAMHNVPQTLLAGREATLLLPFPPAARRDGGFLRANGPSTFITSSSQMTTVRPIRIGMGSQAVSKAMWRTSPGLIVRDVLVSHSESAFFSLPESRRSASDWRWNRARAVESIVRRLSHEPSA